jgi:hypothetical protein
LSHESEGASDIGWRRFSFICALSARPSGTPRIIDSAGIWNTGANAKHLTDRGIFDFAGSGKLIHRGS